MEEQEKNEAAKRLVERLVQLKAEIGQIEGKILSDGAFARRFTGAHNISVTTWSRLCSGTYNDGKIYGKAEDMQAAIKTIEERLPKLRAAAAHAKSFYPTAFVKAVKNRIRDAQDDPYKRRVVVGLAPTGFGKSALVEDLRVDLGAICVEGLQSWKSSYRCFCASIARAAGTPVPLSAKQDRAEEIMLEALSTTDRVLVIDEANTLSGPCANGIKEIVNRTGCTVVLLAIPEFWDKFLEGNAGEVHQVINRCQRVVRQQSVKADDVKLFLRL